MQRLKITLAKYRSKPTVLSCTREDGSTTWTSVYPGLELHELAHFVVEHELALSNSFYGLLAQGHNIEDFVQPRDQRPQELIPANLPQESLVVEHIVNLLQVGFNSSEYDFFETLKSVLTDKQLPIPEKLSPQMALHIQQRLRLLWEQWEQLPQGDKMELEIEIK